jgi:hypothetical protein
MVFTKAFGKGPAVLNQRVSAGRNAVGFWMTQRLRRGVGLKYSLTAVLMNNSLSAVFQAESRNAGMPKA